MTDSADHDEIQRLINTYSQLASQGDLKTASETWVPEGVWAIPHFGMRIEGREAIRGTLQSFMDTMEYVLQLNSPALIEVTGDKATASSGIRESGKTKGKMEAFDFLGLYLDELVRTPEGWRFTVRTFKGLGSQTFPLTTGDKH
jgi:ketosteroid isomerase-like protein